MTLRLRGLIWVLVLVLVLVLVCYKLPGFSRLDYTGILVYILLHPSQDGQFRSFYELLLKVTMIMNE